MKTIDKILELINSKCCPVSAWDILEDLDSKVNKTTVYRNLDKLLESWIILEDFSIEWEKIYSLANHHHHHFVCDNCNKTINIWCMLKNNIKEFEKTYNIAVQNHSFLLRWLCECCK